MTSELATLEARALDRPVTVKELLARREVVQDALKSLFRPGVHFYELPGRKRDDPPRQALGKPGAELVASLFGLALEPHVEDKGGPDEIRYRVTVRVTSIASGRFLGAGVGECSSNEEKYKWRRATGDGEFKATPEDRKRLKWSSWKGKEETTLQVRTNPADIANTVLKMAKKRALVDAVLGITGCSDMFEQSRDDERAEEEEGHEEAAPKETKPRAPKEAPKAEAPAASAPAPKQELALITGGIEEMRSKSGDGWWGFKMGGKEYRSNSEDMRKEAAKAFDAGLKCEIAFIEMQKADKSGTWLKLIGCKPLVPPPAPVEVAASEEPKE